MENDLIFCGYRSGISKEKKNYYKIDFRTPPIISKDQKTAYSIDISVFTTKEKYQQFIDDHSLLEVVKVPYEVNGEKVRHYL